MKRTLSFRPSADRLLVAGGLALIAATYGLVRLAYGLFLPDVQAELGLSARAAGWISSGASLAYCLGALAGLGADRAPRATVAAAMVTGGLGALGMALAPGRTAFAVAAIVASSAAGLASPGLVALVRRHVGAARRDGAQTVVNSGTGPGLVGAGLLALVLLPAWRLGLALGALATVVAGAWVLLAVRGADGGAGQVGERGREQPGGPARPHEPDAARSAVLVPAVGALLLGAASAAVWTYGRSLLTEHGLDATASTLAWIAVGAGGTATVLTARLLARTTPARGWVLTVLVSAIGTAVLAAAPGVPPAALGACLLFGWGFVAATSALIAWAARLRPCRPAGLSALLFVLLVAGQALGSALAGEIGARGSTALAFWAAAGLAALAAAVPAAGGRGGGGRSSRASARMAGPCTSPTRLSCPSPPVVTTSRRRSATTRS